MPDDARGSSLAFTNYYYPGAYRADVRYVDVVGDYARGSANFELVDALCERSDAEATRSSIACATLGKRSRSEFRTPPTAEEPTSAATASPRSTPPTP